MEVVVVTDQAELDRVGAELVSGWLGPAPRGTLLAALGTTPLGIYRELVARREAGTLDTSRLTLLQLDAYLGLGPDDPRSLHGWLRRDVAGPLGIPDDRLIGLRGDAVDPEAACRPYDAAVAACGGIDVSILGLGPNGHLGFNEPPSAPDAPTRVVDLTAESLDSNARYWGGRDRVPRRALTAGMPLLLAARRTLLVVAGAHKREILHRTLREAPSPAVPASLLRTVPGVTILADRAALPDWPADTPTPVRPGAVDG